MGGKTASSIVTLKQERPRTEAVVAAPAQMLQKEEKEVPHEEDVQLVQDLYVPGWITTPPADQVCSNPGNGTILLVTVISAPENIAQRQAIRASWGRFGRRRKDVQVVYLVGRSSKLDAELKEEAKKYSDLVVNNVYDSYENLTLKTLSAFKWHEK